MDLNKVQLIGRITQDIELKQTPNGMNVTTFSLATNRSFKDASGINQDQTEFHTIVFWWKLAEIASQYLWKGKQVYIEGRLQTRNWEAQDWTKRYKTEIVWENLIMLGSKWDSSMGSNSSYENNFSGEYGNETPAVRKTTPKVEEEISIEDIPF